jgi:hypothetical protein
MLVEPSIFRAVPVGTEEGNGKAGACATTGVVARCRRFAEALGTPMTESSKARTNTTEELLLGRVIKNIKTKLNSSIRS